MNTDPNVTSATEEKLYLALVIFSIFGVANGGRWAEGIFQVCSLTLLLHLVWRRKLNLNDFIGQPGVIPLFALVIYALFQTLPLPPLVLEIVSPGTASMYKESIWVVRPGAWMPISVHPEATLSAFGRLFALWAFYLLSLHFLARREMMKRALYALLILAFPLTGIILFLELTNSDVELLNQGVLPPIFLLSFCLFLAIRPRQNYLSWRQRLIMLVRYPAAYPHLSIGAGLILLFLGLLLTISYKGFASLGLGFGLVSLFIAVRDRQIKRAFPSFCMMIFSFLVFGGIYFSSESHLVSISGHEGSGIIHLLGKALPLGIGFGAENALATRVPGTTLANLSDSAVGLGMGGGLVGVLIVGWFLLSVVLATASRWLNRRNRLSVYLYSGTLAILGMVVGLLPWHPLNLGTSVLAFLALSTAILVTSALVPVITRQPSESAALSASGWLRISLGGLSVLYLIYTGSAALAGSTAPSSSVRLNPLGDDHFREKAKISMEAGDPEQAESDLISALRLNPLSPDIRQEVGNIMDVHGKPEFAEKLFYAGVLSDVNNPEMHLRYTQWLLSHNGSAEAAAHIRNMLFYLPDQASTFISLMDQYDLDAGQILSSLPESSLALVELGDFLLARNDQEEAEICFQEALSYLEKESNPHLDAIWRLTNYYANRNRLEEALNVARAGIRHFPEDVGLRRWSIQLYENLGLSYLAHEEKKQISILDAQRTVPSTRKK